MCCGSGAERGVVLADALWYYYCEARDRRAMMQVLMSDKKKKIIKETLDWVEYYPTPKLLD